MLFNSLLFGAFLPSVWLAYWLIGRRRVRAQNAFLAVASYAFYAAWDWRFLSLIWLSTAVDFKVGLALGRAQAPARRKALLALSLALNLGLLGVFKYLGFFVDSAYAFFAALGWHPPALALELVLPMGISFYTFQTLSYTVDIYRRELEPTRDPVAFAAFVSFFPQLVAGPIERAQRLLPQFAQARTFDASGARDGLRQMLWGFVKKLIVADNLAPHVERAFDHPEQFGSVGLAIGAVLFTVQLYCDFSGYSDMAIGMARLFGFDLMRNFAYPFFARSMGEFWRRWHVSLSTWFRDYVYIPLGGSRVTLRRTVLNVMITFTVSGLWHGANWTFVFWGALNGLYLATSVARGVKPLRGTVAEGRLLPTLGEAWAVTRTFALAVFAFIFFRADTMDAALDYVARLCTAGWQGGAALDALWVPLGVSAALALVEWLQRMRPHGLVVHDLRAPARWAIYAALALSLLLFGNTSSREFVYFQF